MTIRIIINAGRISAGISQKKLNELPINKARVVRPNEKPGAWESCEAITQSVTAVVTLNRNNHRQHNTTCVFPKARSGAEANSEMVTTDRAPRRSARKPPANLPANTDSAGSTNSSVVLL